MPNLFDEETQQYYTFRSTGKKAYGQLMTCANCQTEFVKANFAINKSILHFCSKVCSSRYATKMKTGLLVKCQYCGKEIYRKPKAVKKSKHSIFFCSRKCKDSYGHFESPSGITSKMQARKKLHYSSVYCEVCKIELLRSDGQIAKSKTGKFFCSRTCWNKSKTNNSSLRKIQINKYDRSIEEWKAGERQGYKGKDYATCGWLRRYLLEKHSYCCEVCGWGEVNPFTNKVPLTVHHIDGNLANDTEDNLKLLCPNCHSLTHNYGSRNRGTLRPHYR